MNSRRFGDLVPAFETLLAVALLKSAFRTVAGEAAVLVARYKAATPATWGEAIEVPLMVLIAVVEVCQAEVIDDPGAKMSTHDPKLENEERASVLVVEPTVIADGVDAGE